MRVLVVGSLPPPERPRATGLRDSVAELVRQGQVEVVSADPVAAAHRHIGPPGLLACLRLLGTTRRFDAVVVQLEPGLPVRQQAGRLERAISLLALCAALRPAKHVTLRLEALDDLVGGPGGRVGSMLWSRATKIVVGDSPTLEALVDAVGLDRSVVLVGDGDPGTTHGAGSRWTGLDRERLDGSGERELHDSWGDGAEASAANVLALVRARAATERRALLGTSPDRVPGWDRLPAPGAGAVDPASILQTTPVGRAGLSRRILAAGDSVPWLRPITAGARAARRQALRL